MRQREAEQEEAQRCKRIMQKKLLDEQLEVEHKSGMMQSDTTCHD